MYIMGVQFKISSKDFSLDHYHKHVEEFYKKTEPGDVIIFPEDIGLAVAFNGTSDKTIFEAMQSIYLKNKTIIDELQKTFPGASFIKLLFLSLTDVFVKEFHIFFSQMSKKYNVYTVTCNNMAKFKKRGKYYMPINNKVFNTCFVFDKNGKVLFEQDKVNLTQMEKDLGIDSSSLKGVRSFKMNNIKFGIAISLDAFYADYLIKLYDSDIIIQPDANPGKWNAYIENGRWQPEEWMDSSYFIAQRFPKIKYTINPMMVGNILDIIFEGQSCIAKKAEKGDSKMSYVGNPLTTGFFTILGIENFKPTEFISREKIEDRNLDFDEGVVKVEI